MALLRVALVLLVAACGGGGAAGGGLDHLPTLGAGPYELGDDLVSNAVYDFTDPTALELEDGTVRLWFTRVKRTGGELSAIYTATLPEPAPVLALDDTVDVAAPSVLVLPDGRFAMYYEQAGDVHRAVSDDGLTWTKEGVVLAGARHPSALLIPNDSGGEVRLYTDLDGFPEPGAVGGLTPAGQLQVGLFYVQQPTDGTVTTIGYMGSRDGSDFEPFLMGEPVLRGPTDVHGPAVILHPDSGMLFVSRRSGPSRVIAVATHP